MPDGVIYLSAYRYRETGNIELMYADFWMRIHSIETEIWKHYMIDKVIISLTSKKNFRHDLTDKWKDDRDKDTSTMNEKQLKAYTVASELKEYVSKVKALLHQRMASSEAYTVMIDSLQESDDRVIDYAHKGWLVVAMDSDIIHQCPTPVFNYHSKHWKFVHEGLDEKEIFHNIIHSTIVGGHNGDFGVRGVGKIGANKFMQQLEDGEKNFQDWIELFPLPEEALLNYQVTSCSQVRDNKLKLITIPEIADMFDTYYNCPF
jgi:hypothetical protein